jgi:hypothetical protein
MNPPLQLLAEVLGVPHTDDPWVLLEQALTTCGIKVLKPKKADYAGIGKWHRVLKRGDHILVRRASSNDVFHHAIFVGEKASNGVTDDFVVDMHGRSKEDAKLCLRTMDEFLGVKGRPELAVLRYKDDSDEKREKSAWLAEESYNRLSDCIDLYNLLGCNCQHFATWCRTMRWAATDVCACGALGVECAQRLAPSKPGPLSSKLC